MIKKYLIAVLNLLLAPLLLQGQVFSEADFERMILNHPMMKNYDYKTRHFKNTPHELRPVEKLKSENASLSMEIKDMESEKINNYLALMENENSNEEVFWNKTAALDAKIIELNRKIANNQSLILSGGDPGYAPLCAIARDMCKDLLLPLYNKDKVVLNRLPKYFCQYPGFNGKDFHTFWYSLDPLILESYLNKASDLSLMFPNSEKTILYQK